MESWTCSSCGRENEIRDTNCTGCRGRRPQGMTKFYGPMLSDPATKGAPVSEMSLPCFIPDVRYTTGLNWWSHGAMHLRLEGIFLLSEKDGLDTPEKAASRKVPPGDDPITASESVWFPLKSIEKILHNPLAGFCLVSKGKKYALRLTSDGWARLGTYCKTVGIEF